VGRWANWDHFFELEKKGLMMYGQMTAGSWIYIGTQGILQGTYETFAQAGRIHFGSDDLSGRLVLSGGLGGMGGAQPLAATMNNAVFLGVEIDPHRARRRVETRYLDVVAKDLDEAIALAKEAQAKRVGRSIGVIGNAAQVYRELYRRGLKPDLVTDQTSAHDPLNGYIPADLSLEAAAELRQRDPKGYVEKARQSMSMQVEAMLDFARAGSHVFDYGNNIRAQAQLAGLENAFDFPGFVPARASGPSAGWRSREIPRTSAARTRRCWSSSPRSSRCTGGSRWRRIAWPSRVCPRVSAGWATASAPRPACASTRWCARAR
jgi:urocanate hydratase